MSIASSIQEIKRQLPAHVQLVAVSKFNPIEALKEAYDAGQRLFGESQAQELVPKAMAMPDDVKWHFIGHLQTNKVKYIIDKVSMIHSLDSISLAQEIEKQAAKHGIVMDVLVEINSGAEASKGGLLPHEVEDFCRNLSRFPHLRLRGFMTMAPKCENSDEYRKYFKETYRQCLDIWQKKLDNIGGTPILSMGMSASFEAAIMEGATMVRVGGALFRA